MAVRESRASSVKGQDMRTRRGSRAQQGFIRITAGAAVLALTVLPMTSTVAGAINVSTKVVHTSLQDHATIACGSLTFAWNTDVPTTYFQVHATGVSCAIAKNVVVKGGKFHGVPPAGWSYVGTASHGSDCDSTWKRGADRVTGYAVNNGEGC
jgi:hypothetical protein